tara:strand:+ start:3441 stop:4037 length:597 start_codon:yes stop_codon:yes gene_type:complete
MLKIETDSIYLRFMESSDMPIIAPAVTGVWASDALPTEDDQKYFFYQANVQNNTFPSTETILGDTKIGHLNFTICLKSTNAPIGYCITRYVGKSIEQKMTALIPAQRGQKYYTESTIARHRFYYDTLQAEDSSIIIPTSTSTINTSVRQTLDSLYTTNEQVYTIEQGEYRVSKITKDDWTTWINGSDKKSLTYNLTWN